MSKNYKQQVILFSADHLHLFLMVDGLNTIFEIAFLKNFLILKCKTRDNLH